LEEEEEAEEGSPCAEAVHHPVQLISLIEKEKEWKKATDTSGVT